MKRPQKPATRAVTTKVLSVGPVTVTAWLKRVRSTAARNATTSPPNGLAAARIAAPGAPSTKSRYWPRSTASATRRAVAPTSPAVPISSIDPGNTRHFHTGVSELDRVLGGGLVPGSVTLLAGDPGVGKSTLLLEVAHRWAQAGRRALYLSGEESAGQIRLRAERTRCTHDEVYLAAESDLQMALGHIDEVRPSLVVIDSVQTMSTTEADGVTGGVTQVRAVTTALTMAAKTSGVAMLLVGHVTKDGAIAGPRSLEHLVDVVLHFEGDRTSPFAWCAV